MDVPPRVSRLSEWIRSWLEYPECVSYFIAVFEQPSLNKESQLMSPAVKVGPGDTNKGIFVRIKRDGPGKGEVRYVFYMRIRMELTL